MLVHERPIEYEGSRLQRKDAFQMVERSNRAVAKLACDPCSSRTQLFVTPPPNPAQEVKGCRL
eukprot:752229-Hanusia_phi.AAC.2